MRCTMGKPYGSYGDDKHSCPTNSPEGDTCLTPCPRHALARPPFRSDLAKRRSTIGCTL